MKRPKYHQQYKNPTCIKCLRSLDLSDTQKADIKSLMKAYYADNLDEMRARWRLRKQMMQLGYSNEVDQQSLDDLIDAYDEMHAVQIADKAVLHQAIYQLDKQQQQKLQNKFSEKRN